MNDTDTNADTTTESEEKPAGSAAGSERVRCPFCESTDTYLDQRKGSAICRRLYQCNACGQPFEQLR